jgi:5-methyltetrahydrofolate--homocysteine methyltransferase
MPIGAMATAGRQVFHLIRRLRDELGVNTTCGASNISFGLPNRAGINAAFLAMAIGAGMTSAITNPLEPEIRQAILAADVLNGRDANCVTWIRTYRQAPAPGEEGRRRENRRRRG